MFDFDLDSILKNAEKKESNTASTNSYTSDFWKPTLEKGQDKAEYRIRFLPNPDSKNGFCWVERFSHMFKFANGKYCYQPCIKRTYKHLYDDNNKKCYMCEKKNELYNTGDPDMERIGSQRNAKLRYFYNVLILDDPREGGKNNGEIRIFEAGTQVHELLSKFMGNKGTPKHERLFYHHMHGCDFTLSMKMRKTTNGEYQNYDDSYFDRTSGPITLDGKVLSEDEAKAMLEDKCYSLNDRILSDKAFKDYDFLKEVYDNEGMVEYSTNSTNTAPEKEEEEVEPTVEDVTIKNEKVSARNPEVKLDVDREIEDTVKSDETDTSDEDAELAKLLDQ